MDFDVDRGLWTILPYPAIGLAAYAFYRAYTYVFPATLLRKLPGPPNGHFFLGHLPEMVNSSSGEAQQGWVDQYGHVMAYGAFLNRPTLIVSDLRAISHVLKQTDVYQKPQALARFLIRFVGNGVLFAEWEPHRIQRKVLNPAFGPGQLREQTGYFLDTANELRSSLTTAVPSTSGSRLNMHLYLTQATLDIIGRAGFGYEFKALANGLESDEFSRSTAQAMNSFTEAPISTALNMFIPGFERLPTKLNKEIRTARVIIDRIGNKLIAERKADALLESAQGEKIAHGQSRDLLSLLVRANMASDPRERLSDADVLAQIPTFVFAGHETTSSLASWLLYELASNPEVQSSLRAECSASPLPASSKDSEPLDVTELNTLDKLPWLDAVVREALRLHCPPPGINRTALKTEELPLSRPYVDRDGVLHESIAISEGDLLWVPILVVNRSVELWGPDAKEWKPERWINGSAHDGVPEAVKGIPGVYGNMLSFFGGNHSCIGFRFALYEVKIILHTLITTFSFELALPREEYIRKGDIVQHPVIKSEPEKGRQLPMLVRRIKDNT